MKEKPIYDYYGLELHFGTEPLLPIEVTGMRGERADKIRLPFQDGLLRAPEYIPGDNRLDNDDRELFILLVEKNSSEIIKKWLDVFLYNLPLETEQILYNIRSGDAQGH